MSDGANPWGRPDLDPTGRDPGDRDPEERDAGEGDSRDRKPPLLRVEGLAKSFRGIRALSGVSFETEPGTVLGVIGPNGSGKTTLVNAITGFVRPDAGRVEYRGREITGHAPHRITAVGIARTFQSARPFHGLSATQNLIVALRSPRARAQAGGGRWGDRERVALDLLEEVGFERDSAVPERPAGALPQGYLRRLELARCLALRAELIITDELFSGLGSSEVAGILPLIEKLRTRGVGLIMVEHRLRELFELADRIVVMAQGASVADGTPSEIADDPAVRGLYLGADL